MRRILFRFRVVGLLISFYLLCATLVAVLVALDVLATAHAGPSLAKLLLIMYGVTLGAILIVGRAVFVSTRTKPDRAPWVRVTERDQRALWARVTELAGIVGTRPPSRLYLAPDVNAMVWENAHLLGLLPGRRHMVIGVPLLIGLSPAQLDSVVAHELGHYSGRDTRDGVLVARVQASVRAAVRASTEGIGRKQRQLPGSEAFASLFGAYSRRVFRTTMPVSRAQELAADRYSAQVAGVANAVAALREIPVLAAAYDFYLDRYVAAGLPADLLPLPPEVMGGFARMLAEPARQANYAELRTRRLGTVEDPYDSHPPLGRRIATLEALPPDGRPTEATGRRALEILADPTGVLAAVGLRALRHMAAGRPGVDWERLTALGRLAEFDAAAGPLAGAVAAQNAGLATPMIFLVMVEQGRLGPLLDSLPPSPAARRAHATGRLAREYAITTMVPALESWLYAELTRTGRITWRHSWAVAGGELVGPPGIAEAVDAAVAGVSATPPDPRPLRAVLTGVGVPA